MLKHLFDHVKILALLGPKHPRNDAEDQFIDIVTNPDVCVSHQLLIQKLARGKFEIVESTIFNNFSISYVLPTSRPTAGLF